MVRTAASPPIAEINGDFDSFQQSFRDGCSTIAAAITEMGVATASNASPNEMASNIKQIETAPKIANFSVSTNGVHPTLTWTAPGKILYAGLTGTGGDVTTGGGKTVNTSCTFSGNVVSIGTWNYTGNVSAQGFVVYE